MRLSRLRLDRPAAARKNPFKGIGNPKPLQYNWVGGCDLPGDECSAESPTTKTGEPRFAGRNSLL
jgi:hypothetical protein